MGLTDDSIACLSFYIKTTNDVDLVKSRINKSKTSNIIVDIYYKLAEFFYRVN